MISQASFGNVLQINLIYSLAFSYWRLKQTGQMGIDQSLPIQSHLNMSLHKFSIHQSREKQYRFHTRTFLALTTYNMNSNGAMELLRPPLESRKIIYEKMAVSMRMSVLHLLKLLLFLLTHRNTTI